MIISILTDDRDSWYIPYGHRLRTALSGLGHDVLYVHDKKDVRDGDLCFLLSCSRIVPPKVLARNRHNIVVHASDLPAGKGFAPVKWQIYEGQDTIPITLFEAVEAVDAGDWYIKDEIEFEGHELLEEIHEALARKIHEMVVEYVENFDRMTPTPQEGEESFHKRMTAEHDRIDPEKSIAEQWNSFRISDNERFPRWFEYMGHKYILKIEKAEGNE